jgi:hypothetical protein
VTKVRERAGFHDRHVKSWWKVHVHVTTARVGHHRILQATGPSTPHGLAAVLLAVGEQDDMPPHIVHVGG